jgi:serine/threonine-protein kinase
MFITQITYLIQGDNLQYHLAVIGLFAVWAIAGFALQALLDRERTAEFARYAWSATDAVLLTWQLFLASTSPATLLVGYPLLVAASGLFFREKLVAFTTAVSVVLFALLLALRPELQTPPHYAALAAVELVVVGILVAYQVRRVRTLSRYYESRPLM